MPCFKSKFAFREIVLCIRSSFWPNFQSLPLYIKPHCILFCALFNVWKVKVKVAQSCPTLWDPMDYTVHGILQARVLEWVAFPFSRGSSQPRDGNQASYIAGKFFTSWATSETQEYWSGLTIPSPEDLSNSGIEPGSSCIADGFFISWATREASF